MLKQRSFFGSLLEMTAIPSLWAIWSIALRNFCKKFTIQKPPIGGTLWLVNTWTESVFSGTFLDTWSLGSCRAALKSCGQLSEKKWSFSLISLSRPTSCFFSAYTNYWVSKRPFEEHHTTLVTPSLWNKPASWPSPDGAHRRCTGLIKSLVLRGRWGKAGGRGGGSGWAVGWEMERSASSMLSGQSSSIRDLPRPSATISVSSPVVTLNLWDNIAASMQRPGPHFSALELKTAAFMLLLIASMSPLVWSQCLNVGSF